jgi:hypothetical protein
MLEKLWCLNTMFAKEGSIMSSQILCISGTFFQTAFEGDCQVLHAVCQLTLGEWNSQRALYVPSQQGYLCKHFSAILSFGVISISLFLEVILADPGRLGFKWVCTFKACWHMLRFQLHCMSKELSLLFMWLPLSERPHNTGNDNTKTLINAIYWLLIYYAVV